MATAARLQESAQTYRQLCYHRNRGSILFFELLWGMGSPFLAFTVLLPDLLNSLHIKHSFIGLVPAVQTGAWAILQPWSAYAFQPGQRRLLKMSLLYCLGTGGFLLLGLLTCNAS